MINLDKQEIREIVVALHKQAERSRTMADIERLDKIRGKLLSVLSALNTDVKVNSAEIKTVKV